MVDVGTEELIHGAAISTPRSWLPGTSRLPCSLWEEVEFPGHKNKKLDAFGLVGDSILLADFKMSCKNTAVEQIRQYAGYVAAISSQNVGSFVERKTRVGLDIFDRLDGWGGTLARKLEDAHTLDSWVGAVLVFERGKSKSEGLCSECAKNLRKWPDVEAQPIPPVRLASPFCFPRWADEETREGGVWAHGFSFRVPRPNVTVTGRVADSLLNEYLTPQGMYCVRPDEIRRKRHGTFVLACGHDAHSPVLPIAREWSTAIQLKIPTLYRFGVDAVAAGWIDTEWRKLPGIDDLGLVAGYPRPWYPCLLKQEANVKACHTLPRLRPEDTASKVTPFLAEMGERLRARLNQLCGH